ncbi:MAG: class I SAM-dependent methyltransferase [Wenzhouxiangellaceae bacterium]
MLERIPEPELMDEPAQAQAYAAADFSTGNQSFVAAVLQRYAPRPEHGVLYDLGCGPADITLRLARELPSWRCYGLDGGPNMLQTGIDACAAAGLTERVQLRLSFLPDPALPQAHADALVSNSLLHHLSDPLTLWRTISHLAKPGAYVQVMDLSRPASRDQARALVDEYAGDEPEVLRQDFYHSLLAAYRPDEVRAQLNHCGLQQCAIEQYSDRHWLVSGWI